MKFELLNCAVCGAQTLRHNWSQKYCATCSEEQDKKRKTKWASLHPQKVNYSLRKMRNEDRREMTAKIGIEKTNADRQSIAWEKQPQMVASFSFALPWTTALLKNHCWSLGRGGHVFLRQETRALEEEIIWKVRDQKSQFKHNKIWVSILAQKPNHKSGDAVNLLDRTCDAIKKALEIDDRWFCVRCINWEIVKENPKIFISIEQEECENSQVCSICGRILAWENFGKRTHGYLGISRECRECRGRLKKIKKTRALGVIDDERPGINQG